jgi:hypothetical protein
VGNEQTAEARSKDQQSAGYFEFFMRKYHAEQQAYAWLGTSIDTKGSGG